MANSRKPLAFVLMPFDKDFKDVYESFIKKSLSNSGYKVLRADDIQSNRSIMQDVISHIENADLIVADLTTNNPNVYYELGIAHSFRKKVILLTQDIDELPFDLRPYRVISYSTHFQKIRESEKTLEELASGAIEDRILFGNPVIDYSNKVYEQPQNSGETTTELEVRDERGFLDHLDDFEEGTREHTDITVKMTEVTKKIGQSINKAAAEMRLAKSKQNGGATKWQKRVSTKLAAELNSYTDQISNYNHDQKKIIDNIENSSEYVLQYINIKTKEDSESIKELVTSFSKFLTTSKDTKESIVFFINSLNDGLGLEKNLDKAYTNLINALSETLSNIDQMVSMYERGLKVAKQKLKESKVN